jgi:hypothetical protein
MSEAGGKTEETVVPPARRVLAIFVLEKCPGFERARQVAAAIESAALDLRVHVIDLGAAGAVRPPAVFAVPTYVLDGQVIALGNPEPEWLLRRLAEPVPAMRQGDP